MTGPGLRGAGVGAPFRFSFSAAPADCVSTVANPADDVAGFLNGFITVTSIGTAGSITS